MPRAGVGGSNAREILRRHSVAHCAVADHHGRERRRAWFATPIDGPDLTRLPTNHGLSLKHVGSLSTLVHALSQDDPQATLRRFDLTARASIPPELVWCAEWVRAAEDLFRRCAP